VSSACTARRETAKKRKKDWRMFTGSSRPESGRIIQQELSLNSQAGDSEEEEGGLEDVHRIIQARIR
jgi:hypothetical protein